MNFNDKELFTALEGILSDRNIPSAPDSVKLHLVTPRGWEKRFQNSTPPPAPPPSKPQKSPTGSSGK